MKKLVVEFAIANMDEFNELVEKAKRQYSELQTTLDEINAFDPKISYPKLEEKRNRTHKDSSNFAEDMIDTIKATLNNRTEGL